MSGLQRKYLSGAAKRKLAEKKKEDEKKLRKISDFLQDNSDKAEKEGLVKPSSVASIDTTTSRVEEVVSLLDKGSIDNHTEERMVDSHVLSETLEPISVTNTEFVNVVTPKEQCSASETNFETVNTNIESQGIISINNDVAKWPATINTNFIDRCLVKGINYFQNRFDTYSGTEKKFGEETRRLTNDIFFRSMKNGERNERFWLVFSPSTQKLFCVACKLFNPDQHIQFVSPGFDDWKNIHARVQSHENNIQHRKTMITLLSRLNPTTGINKQIIKQVESETKYWQEVLRRVVAVIKFLCERGLSFRGDEELIGSARNGNFLGLLELIAQFDPFLKAHIEKYGKKKTGNVSYLSKTICDEFIQLMGQRVSEVITEEIKSAKYFSLIVDSTPDISHVDQLSIVIRYCHEGKVYERLLGFLPITSHTGMSLYQSVSEFLRKADLDLKNCRGQSYDNASNMSGKFEGLQAHIKKTCDKAFYIPCAGHSLNLVGVHAVESCQEATNFFGFLQKLYVFFSGSTRKWDIFKKFLNAGDSMQVSVLKSLSSTRWSCHAESCKSLLKNYDAIIGALSEIVNNDTEPIDSLREAQTLLKQIMKKETSLMTMIWGKILERVNATSTELQKLDIDLSLAVTLLQSLKDTIARMRSEFSDFEIEAAALSAKIDPDFRDASKRKIIKKFSDKTVEPELLSGRRKFEIETFFVIIDKLVTELAKRLSAYEFLNSIFGLITNFEIDGEDLRQKLATISQTYREDLDDDLLMEWTQFSSFVQKNFLSCGLSASPREILHFLVKNDLGQVFPNILIIYRLYLTIPVTNCSSERSFSKLSLIKNRLRSSLGEEKLNALLLLSIESDLTRALTFEDIIKDFANKKARKVVL